MGTMGREYRIIDLSCIPSSRHGVAKFPAINLQLECSLHTDMVYKGCEGGRMILFKVESCRTLD